MNLKIVGRSFGSSTVAEKDETGNWVVVVTMTEQRKLAGGDWEDKKISSQCTDRTFEKAYATAMNSTLEQFSDILDKTNNKESLFDDLPEEEETTSGEVTPL